jgi:hypothetical protein
MKITFLMLLVITAFLVGGCDKSPTSTADKSSSKPPVPIQAEAFHGQVYKSFDQRKVLTLISKDECELSEQGTILLCKYTKQDDKLRVVTTTLGTSQVLYYRVTNQGLQDNDGNVLFSPEGLLDAQRQVELANRQAAEQARVQAEEQAKEQQRLAARLQESHTTKAIIFSSEEPAILYGLSSDQLLFVTKTTVSDVSVTCSGTKRIEDASWESSGNSKHITEPFERTFWFGETGKPRPATGWNYYKKSGPLFQMNVPSLINPRSDTKDVQFFFERPENLESFVKAVTESRESWRVKYPELINGFYLGEDR